MERALVVTDDTEQHRDLLQEAGELAAGVDAQLVLLATIDTEEYTEGMDTLAAINEIEDTGYGNEQILEMAGELARDVGGDALEEIGVNWGARGAVVESDGADSEAETILQVAESEECDHIFLPGRRRSPTGKAVFGDTAQSVILNFDGAVTVTTA